MGPAGAVCSGIVYTADDRTDGTGGTPNEVDNIRTKDFDDWDVDLELTHFPVVPGPDGEIDIGSILHTFFSMESTFFTCKSLNNSLCFLIYQVIICLPII